MSTSTLATLLLLLHAELSSGHAILVNPKARCGQGELTNPAIKLRPFADATTTANQGCGGAGNYAGNYPDGPQDVVAVYEPGQPLDVQWLMTIPHDADRLNTGVRIAIHYANGDSFADNILIDGGDAGTDRGTTITETVEIPADKTCENCVLQWMWAAEQDGGFYLACADIAIREGGGTAPPPPVCARQAAPEVGGEGVGDAMAPPGNALMGVTGGDMGESVALIVVAVVVVLICCCIAFVVHLKHKHNRSKVVGNRMNHGGMPPAPMGPQGGPPVRPGWQRKMDPASGQPYYVNMQTGQSQWSPP